ncbi:MAG: protein BatD [Bacteroidales bacterium]|nr:protein BatD [Bacteroidales bacterium]
MKAIKSFLLLMFLLTTATVGHAQTCTAQAPAKVGINQQFQYSVTLNQDGNISSTDFGPFTKVGGPSSSTSTSISFVNGQQSTSHTTTFTYVLKPTKLGKQTIPGVTCNVGGKSVKSNAVTVEVTKEDQQTQQQRQRFRDPFEDFFRDPWGDQQRQQQQQPSYDVFVRGSVSNTAPFQGEVVTVVYKLYTYNVAQWQANDVKMPQQTDLWTYRLDDPDGKLVEKTETINGKRYSVYEIYRSAVAPQKSGSLTISPFSLDMTMIVGRGFWASRSDQTIKSNTLTLNVKPLPKANRPDDFSGLVGQYELTSTLAPTEVDVNDAADFTVTLSGKGAIQLADLPEFNFPDNIDVTDPIIDDKVTTANGLGGKRTFKYVLIPRQNGTYVIPATTFSYFDPTSQTYKQLSTQACSMKVKGEGSTAKKKKENDTVEADGTTDVVGNLKAFFSKYWILFVLIPVLIIVVILVLLLVRLLQRSKGKKSPAQKRVRHANRIAARRLKKAQKLMTAGEDDAFFEEVAHALWDYLGHKFRIPLADLSIDAVRNKLIDKGMSEDEIAQFTQTLDNCEYSRFAPGDKAEMMSQLYDQARDFITRMEGK